MQLDLHYVEPRLVALYDRDNPRGIDYDFYLALADDVSAKKIVDLGCGTGLLTRELAATGREVIGVDPAGEMLAYAQRQPGAEQVQWLEGDISILGHVNADLAIMTGNVAQVFLTDEAWLAALRGLRAALRPGGHIAFESRNPAARGWEKWRRETTHCLEETPFGRLESWLEVTAVRPGLVTFAAHNIFQETGEELVVTSSLRFRDYGEIIASMEQSGFAVVDVFGGWEREPFQPDSHLMVFVGRCV